MSLPACGEALEALRESRRAEALRERRPGSRHAVDALELDLADAALLDEPDQRVDPPALLVRALEREEALAAPLQVGGGGAVGEDDERSGCARRPAGSLGPGQ